LWILNTTNLKIVPLSELKELYLLHKPNSMYSRMLEDAIVKKIEPDVVTPRVIIQLSDIMTSDVVDDRFELLKQHLHRMYDLYQKILTLTFLKQNVKNEFQSRLTYIMYTLINIERKGDFNKLDRIPYGVARICAAKYLQNYIHMYKDEFPDVDVVGLFNKSFTELSETIYDKLFWTKYKIRRRCERIGQCVAAASAVALASYMGLWGGTHKKRKRTRRKRTRRV